MFQKEVERFGAIFRTEKGYGHVVAQRVMKAWEYVGSSND